MTIVGSGSCTWSARMVRNFSSGKHTPSRPDRCWTNTAAPRLVRRIASQMTTISGEQTTIPTAAATMSKIRLQMG